MRSIATLACVAVCLCALAAATTADAQAVNPYLFNFQIQSGSHVDFTATQYSGNSTDPANFIDDWSGSSDISGSMQAALWQDFGGTYTDIQMNDMNVYGDSTIGYSDWFYMDTNWGDTRARARLMNLNITDNNVPGNAPIDGGNFLIPDYQSQMYGTLEVEVEYWLKIWPFPGSWVAIPFVSPIQESLADHNDPPPTNDLGGSVSGSGAATVLTTNQSIQQTMYMNDYSGEYGITADYTLATDFDSSVTANATGAPTLLLSADAGANTTVYGPYGNGSLNATGSSDPQDDAIVSYAWDLNGDGLYNDKTGSTATVTEADLVALGLGFGEHAVGLLIQADDGYWATDQLTLSYLPSLLGDANIDGDADTADYTLWADNYNTGSNWGQGDFNLDGDVDTADYTLWADNYGAVASSGGEGRLLTSSIPEPATISLLGLAALALLRRRKHGV